MRFLAATIIATAGVAIAQTGLGQVPKCAQPCLNNFLASNTIAGCQAFDAKCICENQDFLAEIACCLVDSCTADEQKDTVAFAHAICKTVQVTNLPDEVACSTTAAGAATTLAQTASEAPSAASDSISESVTEAPSTTAAAAGNQSTSTPNAGPVATMAPVGIIGGVIAAVALL